MSILTQKRETKNILPPLLYRKFEKYECGGIEFLSVHSLAGAIYPKNFDPQDTKLQQFMQYSFISLDKIYFIGKLSIQKLKQRYNPELKFNLCTFKIGETYFNSYLLYLLLKKVKATNSTQIKIYVSTKAEHPIMIIVNDKVLFLAPIVFEDDKDLTSYEHPDLAEFYGTIKLKFSEDK